MPGGVVFSDTLDGIPGIDTIGSTEGIGKTDTLDRIQAVGGWGRWRSYPHRQIIFAKMLDKRIHIMYYNCGYESEVMMCRQKVGRRMIPKP